MSFPGVPDVPDISGLGSLPDLWGEVTQPDPGLEWLGSIGFRDPLSTARAGQTDFVGEAQHLQQELGAPPDPIQTQYDEFSSDSCPDVPLISEVKDPWGKNDPEFLI
eukprot:gene20564-27356_t